MVNCVLTDQIGNRPRWVPVLGDMHQDDEYILATPHQHYDLRFLSDRMISTITGPGTPIFFAVVTRVLNGPSLHRRKCYRQMPEFPWDMPHWYERVIPILEERYTCSVIDPSNPVCPHQGLPILAEKDGVLTCSGHGLSFDARTGKLITRGRRCLTGSTST